jgi:hypothetical protein
VPDLRDLGRRAVVKEPDPPPGSYQPTAATPSLASNQCDEQLTVTGAFESTAPLVNIPFSSVSHEPSGVIAPLFSLERSQVSNFPWPRQPPGGIRDRSGARILIGAARDAALFSGSSIAA